MNKEIIDALNWRYAVKEFDPSKKVSTEDLTTILESGRLAASSQGIEAWGFVVVENPELRLKLQEASYGQTKVTQASHLVVIARRTDVRENIADERVARTAAIQNKTEEELTPLRKMVEGSIAMRDDAALTNWISAQTYIPLGAMLETAALLRVDSGPMEGFVADQVDEILGLAEKNLSAVTMLTLGYRSESDVFASFKKVRRSFDEVVHFIK